MSNIPQRETILKRALADVTESYDYVIIDCPPSLGLLPINALAAANGVLIPIQCEYYALEGVSQLMNTVNLVKRSLNPNLEVIGVLLTMYDARTNLGSKFRRGTDFFGKPYLKRHSANVRLQKPQVSENNFRNMIPRQRARGVSALQRINRTNINDVKRSWGQHLAAKLKDWDVV
jgi:chromosome partitioning protein